MNQGGGRDPSALAVERWGEGPPVVFIHGLGASARYWHPVRSLDGPYRGIAPDLLGFGTSPKPEASRYDVDAHLAALLPLIPEGSIVVAHSAGAILAAALAARRPDLVRAAILIGLPVFPDRSTAEAELGRLGMMARLTVRGGPAAYVSCKIMCRTRPLAAALAPWFASGLPADIAADSVRHTWSSYSRTTREVVLGYRVIPDLAASPVPLILLHGQDDRTAPVDYASRAADAAPHVRLRLVGGDHHVAVRRPKVVLESLRQLLRFGPGAIPGF